MQVALLQGIKNYREHFRYNAFNLTVICLLLSALTQCVAIGLGNIFLLLSLLFSTVYIYRNVTTVIGRIKKYKVIFIFYLIFLLSMLPSVFLSPDVGYSGGWFIRKFIYRSAPFLLVLLVCPENRYTKLLVKLTLISFIITSIGGLFFIHENNWRIHGLFGHPMTLAGFLCLIGPLIFCSLYQPKTQVKKFCAYAAICVFMVFIALMNGTRGAWIALFTSLLIIGVWFSIKTKRNILILAILVMTIAISVGSSSRFTERLASVVNTTYTSNVERIEMWKTAYKIWNDNSISGVGYNRFKDEFKNKYVPSSASVHKYSHPHNDSLYVLAESGIVGFLGYWLFFGFVLIYSFIKLVRTRNEYYLLIFVTTLSLQLHGMTEYNFGNQAVIKLYWLLLGCYVCLANRRCQEFPY